MVDMSKIKSFGTRLWDSSNKLTILLVFMFLPLLINLAISIIQNQNFNEAILSKIIPGEIYAYSLSLISPLFIMLIKTHGSYFRVPALKPMFIISFIVYCLSLSLIIIAKNGFIKGIDLKAGHRDFYFWSAIIFLSTAIILRLYTDFQESRYVDYKTTIEESQNNLTKNLLKKLNK